MFNPASHEDIKSWDLTDLAGLPTTEDEIHEYKSSRTSDNDLKDKIAKAASGFWNSGGGLFVAGVDGNGRPDGGLLSTVGRQSRRDWIDKVIASVSPTAKYAIQCINGLAGTDITTGNAVVLIAFGPSEMGPHMGPDKRYYVRIGAHTDPASHFLLEALWARRHAGKPRLMHLPNTEHFTSGSNWLSIRIVCVTATPALDVVIDIEPRPDSRLGPTFPLRATLIDSTQPYQFGFEIPRKGFITELRVSYTDLAGNPLHHQATITSTDHLPNYSPKQGAADRIVDAIRELGRTVERCGRVN